MFSFFIKKKKSVKMLADVIMEEDFDKEPELWYSRKELEHGKVPLNSIHGSGFQHRPTG